LLALLGRQVELANWVSAGYALLSLWHRRLLDGLSGYRWKSSRNAEQRQ
jgi:hypothetical protein